jgi:uncharacterized protein YutE (UPF0331/DUF86 family)
MSADREFILREAREIGKAINLIEPLLSKAALDPYETIALGTLLQNVYTGIENILRCRLQMLGAQPPRSENWHKDLLEAAMAHGLIDPAENPVLRDLLLYRHRHVHGYGHMLDEFRLKELAAAVPSVCRGCVERLSAFAA